MIPIIVICLAFLLIFFFAVRLMAYQHRVIYWCDERELYFRKIFQEAEVITSIPPHGKSLRIVDDKVIFTESNLATPVNYQTLVQMTKILVDQEEARRGYSQELSNSLQSLRDWEKQNPLPEKPRFR